MKFRKVISVCLAVCFVCISLCFIGCNGKSNDKVSALEEDIARLSDMISSLSDTVKTNEADIAELEAQVADYETRLSLLEGAAETPVLHMGDTYTLKSPTGIEMFKVRLLEYKPIQDTEGNDTDERSIVFNIQRLNIPNSVPTDMYFTVAVYSEKLNRYTFKLRHSSSDRYYGKDFSVRYESMLSGTCIPNEDVTYILVGMPSECAFRTTDITSDSYIIPYAKFVL